MANRPVFFCSLLFQKGKFYELYEDDALIGHQEFDLKLTDRVGFSFITANRTRSRSGPNRSK